jgi:3-deoxy-manno-octulosonate cytidylyltransferase (CMP-KDO synthetase)
MIQRVYQRASESLAEQVIVATDDQRIFEAVKAFGGDVEMTANTHQSGTDRIQEVAKKRQFSDDAVVVNLQGDEPFMAIDCIEQVAANLVLAKAGISTLCERISCSDELHDPNAVKVVRDKNDMALYFSRAAIPYNKVPTELDKKTQWFRHCGIYAYRVNVLNQFVHWPSAMLEDSESLEQLRALTQGVKIHCAEAAVAVPGGIDTQQDLDAARSFVQKQARP